MTETPEMTTEMMTEMIVILKLLKIPEFRDCAMCTLTSSIKALTQSNCDGQRQRNWEIILDKCQNVLRNYLRFICR